MIIHDEHNNLEGITDPVILCTLATVSERLEELHPTWGLLLSRTVSPHDGGISIWLPTGNENADEWYYRRYLRTDGIDRFDIYIYAFDRWCIDRRLTEQYNEFTRIVEFADPQVFEKIIGYTCELAHQIMMTRQ